MTVPTHTRRPAAPKTPPGNGAKIAAGIITAVIAIGCLVGGIALFSGGGAKTPATSAQAPVAEETPAAASTLRSQMICEVTGDDGGSFYLSLISATMHDFSACVGGTPYDGSIDKLLASGHGTDLRCYLSNAFILANNAGGGVYSTGSKADRAAASEYCAVNGTKEPGR